MTVSIPDKKSFERDYVNMQQIYKDVIYDVAKQMRNTLESISLHYNLKYRVKSFESYYKKYIKK